MFGLFDQNSFNIMDFFHIKTTKIEFLYYIIFMRENFFSGVSTGRELYMIANYILRIAFIILGMLVSAADIVMMLNANIGPEPWSVLKQGMSDSLSRPKGLTFSLE